MMDNKRRNSHATLPHNLDAEKAMLGCILYNSVILPEVLVSGITEEHFCSLQHRAVWRAIKLLCEKRDGMADPVTVSELIRHNADDSQMFDDVAGYCDELVNKAYTPSAWSSYALSLNRYYKRRKLIKLADKAKQTALEMQEEDDIETILSEVSESFFKEEMQCGGGITNSEALEIKMQEWRDAVNGTKASYPCYLRDVESKLGGFVKGKPYFIAAPPADGKSTFMINQAEAWARLGIRVAIASLEMEHSELMGIMAAKIAEVSAFALRTAYGGETIARSRLDCVERRALPELTEDSAIMRNIKINDSQMNIDEICSWIRYMKHRNDIQCVIVDYLQIIGASRGFRGTTREMINDIVNKLKIVAKETGVTLLCLSQLTKDARKGERRPHKSDLKESGTIEEVAYGVILMYFWEDVFYADVAKNRGGLNGIVELDFDKPKQHIKDKEQVYGSQAEEA